MGALKEGDVDFCYGSRDGQLWIILDKIFNLGLKFETSTEAVKQRIEFLRRRKIGICDIVASAERKKVDATDLGMTNVKLRNLIGYLQQYPEIDTLLFTGGNSKNGPEYFFRKHIKEYGTHLKLVSDKVPRIHQFTLPDQPKRSITTVSLTAPSGSANRAVGSLESYKSMKIKNPEFNTIDFRVIQYRDFF